MDNAAGKKGSFQNQQKIHEMNVVFWRAASGLGFCRFACCMGNHSRVVACGGRMDHMLPCDYFLRGGDYRWPAWNNDKVAGRKSELEGMVRVIRKYESVFGVEHLDHCYEAFAWDRGDEDDEGCYLDDLFRRHYLPADFVEEYLWDVCPRQRTVVMDLELLRRVHRWYIPDVEE